MLNMTREFFIPKTCTLVHRDEALGAEAYADQAGLVLMLFGGKRQKPDHHIRFHSAERATIYLQTWISGLQANIKRKVEMRERKKAFCHGLKIGDVLKSSWGYDQTIVQFYEITALIAKHTVELRELVQVSIETCAMQGKCTPLPGEFKGAPFRRRVLEGNTVKISSCQWASKLEPMHMVGSVPAYRPSHWTAYA